ncbi:hypothetical protein [Iamia sp.]|uniref:hypothetical protein n=1 Tax=Iamia sp. TaxID=2722710 RepID=UPI002BB3272C|nr:hypothetical protein [Iamia sp.]HXH58767.1 hypothetical protein [Iamia sp.]
MTAILDRRGGVLPAVDAAGGERLAGLDGPRLRGDRRDGAPQAARRLRRLWIIPAGVVVAGALALLPALRDGGPGPGEAEVVVAGAAAIVRADGTRSTVTDGTVRLGRGDSLEVSEGTARFELADDVRFEGHAGDTAGGRTGTTVRMDLTPELVAGGLLVVAPERTSVRAAGTTVRVAPAAGRDGAARLDRRIGLGVGTYHGQVDADSAGRAATVPDLHRIEVATPGSVGRRDLALRYAADDGWDRRFLGDALTIDRQLAPLLAGLSASGGPDLTSADGLRRASPGLPSEARLAPLLADVGSNGDALVLAALTDLGEGGTFASRWEAAVRFRGDGARWGLVALDRDVAPAELLGAIRGALDRLSFPFGADADGRDDTGDADDAAGVDGGTQDVTGGAQTRAPGGNDDPGAASGSEPGAPVSGSGLRDDPAAGPSPGADGGDPATGGTSTPPADGGDPATGGAPTPPATASGDPPAPAPEGGPSPAPPAPVPPLPGGGEVPDVTGPLPSEPTVPPVPEVTIPPVTVPPVPGVTDPLLPGTTVPPVPVGDVVAGATDAGEGLLGGT